MLGFWKQNFVPNNAALVVAGDITMAELRPLAEKVFGAWQRGTPAKPAVASPAATQARILIVDRPGAPQTQIRVGAIGADRKSTRLNSSHLGISYAVFCLKKKKAAPDAVPR